MACFLAAAGLRTPLAVPGPYPAPFGMVPHAGMNGELTSPGAAYAGLHSMSPQMSAAAAAAAAAVVAYGRSPMVRHMLRRTPGNGQLKGCRAQSVGLGQWASGYTDCDDRHSVASLVLGSRMYALSALRRIQPTLCLGTNS